MHLDAIHSLLLYNEVCFLSREHSKKFRREEKKSRFFSSFPGFSPFCVDSLENPLHFSSVCVKIKEEFFIVSALLKIG